MSRTKIEDAVKTKLKPIIEKLDGYNLYISVHTLEDENTVAVEIAYTRKYFEISEAVQTALENAEAFHKEPVCNPDNPDECEKVFEEAYKEELDRINEECAIRANGTIELKDYNAVISIEPVLCDGDYCDCGVLIVFNFKLDISETNEEATAEYIAKFIEERLPPLLQVIL